MNVRGTFRAAPDRAPQCESRFPYPAPKVAVKKQPEEIRDSRYRESRMIFCVEKLLKTDFCKKQETPNKPTVKTVSFGEG